MKPTRITVHCSATKNGKRCPAGKIKLWHLANGWSDIGYHAVIQPNGETEKYPNIGRALNVQGAHVAGENEGNLGICLIGTDKFHVEQFKALRYLLDSWRMSFMIDADEIYCHYEFDSARKQGKTCPSIRAVNLILWYTQFDLRPVKPWLLPQEDEVT